MAGRKKAPNGAGTVYHVKSRGVYIAAVSVGGGKRLTKTAKSRKEAHAHLRSLLDDRDAGAVPAPSNYTVARLMGDWLESTRSHKTPSTFANYKSTTGVWITPYLGGNLVTRLTAPMVQRWLDSLPEKGTTTENAARALELLKIALNRAVKQRIIRMNVAALVDAPKGDGLKRIPLGRDNIPIFLLAIQHDRLRDLYLLGLFTGLRISEALGLRWQDVDLERGILTVDHQLQWPGGNWVLAPPKSRAGIRRVGILSGVVHLLEEHRRSADPQPEDFVFRQDCGKPWRPEYVAKLLRKVTNGAGLPPIRFHDLRHEFEDMMREAGVDPRTNQSVMGHSNIRMTMKYGSTQTRDLVSAAGKVDHELRPLLAGLLAPPGGDHSK